MARREGTSDTIDNCATSTKFKQMPSLGDAPAAGAFLSLGRPLSEGDQKERARAVPRPRERSFRGDAPGGKTARWHAYPSSPSSDMPVESFFRFALKPYMWSESGTGI